MAVTESVFRLIRADGQVDTSTENSCLILLLNGRYQAAAVPQVGSQNRPLFLLWLYLLLSSVLVVMVEQVDLHLGYGQSVFMKPVQNR